MPLLESWQAERFTSLWLSDAHPPSPQRCGLIFRDTSDDAFLLPVPGDPTSVRVLLSPLSALVVAVNETSSDVRRQVSVEKSIYEVRLPAGRSCSALIDRNSGNVVALTASASFVRQK